MNLLLKLGRIRHARRFRCREIDHMPHCDVSAMGHLPHTNTAQLNEPCKQRRRPSDQDTILRREHHPIVRDQLGRREGAGAIEDEAQGQRGFAGA